MKNIKLEIAYDGTDYHGWQIQLEIPTIELHIRQAIFGLTGCDARINGASRTDSGVHALGQVANIHIDTLVPIKNLARALNRLLPKDIAVTSASIVDDDFDAITSVETKLYRYSICTGPARPVLNIRQCWHRPGKLNINDMKTAAQMLVGKHDFKSFASAADQRLSSVRTIMQCSVEKNDDWIYINIEADGFLYNMVRNIVGTLIEVGRGRWKPQTITDILEAKDRAAAGPTAPPAGLCLMWIKYQKEKI